MKKITIFTPTFNRKKQLIRVFKSLQLQKELNFIWLIIDDGSTDDTEETVKEFMKNSKFEIKYIKQENRGKHIAHNKAVQNCNTDYFLILDSDDLLDNEAIKTLNKYIIEIDLDDNISGIIGNRYDINTGQVIGKKIPDVLIASGMELYQKYKFCGDTLRMYKTKILKEYLFPCIENEKFMYENVVFDRIDSQYKMLVIQDKLYYGEYLENGYTSRSKFLKFKNPYGYALSLLSSAQYSVKLINKFKYYLLFCIWVDVMNVNIKNQFRIILFPLYKFLEIIKCPKFFFEILNYGEEIK